MNFVLRKECGVIAFLFVALFFPTKFIHFYYALMLCFILSLFYFCKIRFIGKDVFLYASLMIVVLSLFMLRYTIIGLENLSIRDVIEYGRVFFIISVFAFFSKFKFDISIVLFVLKIYLLIDVFVSFAQFFSIGGEFIKLITFLYADINQIEGSLEVSRRALGLSSDPSAHGLMILVILMALSVRMFFYSKQCSIFDYALLLLGMISILLSQSQTAFLGLVFFVVGLLLSFAFYRRSLVSKQRVTIFVLLLAIVGVYVFYAIFEQLRYLITLFSLGLERSSYVAREDKTAYILSMALEYPVALVLTGLGKDFFGIYSRAMDNEHLYMLTVWGALFYIFYLYILGHAIFIFFKRKNKHGLFFSISFIVGMPLAWPSVFYLVPNISILLILFYCFYKHQSLIFRGSSESCIAIKR